MSKLDQVAQGLVLSTSEYRQGWSCPLLTDSSDLFIFWAKAAQTLHHLACIGTMSHVPLAWSRYFFVTGYGSGGAVRAGVMVHVVLGTMLDGSEWLSLWCQEKAWSLITE